MHHAPTVASRRAPAGPARGASFDAAIAAAQDAFRSSDWDGCARAADRAIRLQPRRADGHHLLGLARRQQDRMEEARAAADAALRLAPNNAIVRRTAGMTAAIHAGRLHAAGRLDDALEAARAGLAIAPEVQELWCNQGVVLQELGRCEEAEEALREAVRLAPHDAGAWNNLGNLLHDRLRLTEALQALEEAVRLDPRCAEAWLNYGNVMRTMGREADAAQAYGLAAELMPTLLQAPSNMADLVRQQGNAIAAIGLFRAVLAQSDRLPLTWYGLGLAEDDAGDDDAAAACFERALALRPGMRDAVLSLARVRCDQGLEAEADALVQRALATDPDHPRAWSLRATVQKGRGELAEAQASARRAVELEWQALQAQPDVGLLCDRSRKPMKVEHAGIALLMLKDLLDTLGVPFFLAYGTLLGIVRDGEMLPFDKDMDVGVPWDVDRRWLVEQVEASGTFHVKNRERLTDAAAEWNISVVHEATGVLTDLFFFRPEGDTLLSGFHHLPQPLLWRFSRFETAPLLYRGVPFEAPADPERFLTEIYGADWRIPDPYFDSVVTGRNLVASGRDVSVLFGLLRLHGKLQDRAWKKALGYCRQLLTYGDDPFLAALAGWLAERLPAAPASLSPTRSHAS